MADRFSAVSSACLTEPSKCGTLVGSAPETGCQNRLRVLLSHQMGMLRRRRIAFANRSSVPTHRALLGGG